MMAISSASLSLTSTGTIGTSCRPASWEARQRRSPAMISKRSWAPFTGRTTIGWITPCCLIEAASSLSSASEKVRRGLRGLGLRNSIGTLRWLRGRSTCAASPPTSPIRLARPRPSRERVSSAIAASSLGFTSPLRIRIRLMSVLGASKREPGIPAELPDQICGIARLVRNDVTSTNAPSARARAGSLRWPASDRLRCRRI